MTSLLSNGLDMERPSELEEFVKSWKAELSSKKSNISKGDGEVSVNESSSVEPSNLESAPASSACRPDRPRSPEARPEYGPFGFIGRLFGEDSKQSRGSHVASQSESLSDMTAGTKRLQEKHKRKSLELKPSTKKLKSIDIKDIFVERNPSALPSERLLDRLIADIDEITEIPFFDISVPREVAIKIFQYLSLKDLCNCAQVSKGWRSLAEDEWLWCRICHQLGKERIYSTRDKSNWKEVVKHNIERQRLLVTNWKGRVGKLSQLDHTKGKILCSVDFWVDIIAAGYTNGEVKLWDLNSGDTCVFQPSDTSLTLSNHGDGQVSNIVEKVVTSQHLTAATYTHGNMDIWSLESGTQPLYTHHAKFKQIPIDNLCMAQVSSTFALSYGSYVDVLSRDREMNGFICKHQLNCGTQVLKLKLLETSDAMLPSVVIGQQNVVSVYCPRLRSEGHMTEVHNLSEADVQVMDVQPDPGLIAVGLRSYFGLQCGYRIRLYDVAHGKLIQTLRGSASTLSSLNLHDSPAHFLATAAGDSGFRVFIYDLRHEDPVMTLLGNSCRVTTLQMDEWKVVAGRTDGFVCVWDQRMATKLWEWHNRHPVRYCRFHDKTLVTGNVADEKFPATDEFEYATHRRYRGSVQVYDFLSDQMTKGLPEICLSSYDQPDASKYNIGLAMPYDTLTY